MEKRHLISASKGRPHESDSNITTTVGTWNVELFFFFLNAILFKLRGLRRPFSKEAVCFEWGKGLQHQGQRSTPRVRLMKLRFVMLSIQDFSTRMLKDNKKVKIQIKMFDTRLCYEAWQWNYVWLCYDGKWRPTSFKVNLCKNIRIHTYQILP